MDSREKKEIVLRIINAVVILLLLSAFSFAKAEILRNAAYYRITFPELQKEGKEKIQKNNRKEQDVRKIDSQSVLQKSLKSKELKISGKNQLIKSIWQREYSCMVNGQELAGAYSGGVSWSKPTFADIDNDGDFDLFMGTLDGNIIFYRNDGSSDDPLWTFVGEDYNSIDIGECSAPVFVDIDNDQDLDLFIGGLDGNLHFYQNDGSPENPSWSLISNNFNAINVGFFSTPTFADIDDDGDLDLFIGNEEGYLHFYQNDGSSENPSWILITNKYISVIYGDNSVPVFNDIDNDGDLDLFIGGKYGYLNFFQNDGAAENPIWNHIAEQYNAWRLDQMCAPFFVDIDNDGDSDLFMGEEKGNLHFCRNTPLETSSFSLVTENYLSIDLYGVSSPTFTDIDNDGDLDLFIGGSFGRIEFYRNEGQPDNPSLTLITTNYNSIDVGKNSRPIFGDIDNDGDYDLFIGNYDGKMYFYRNDGTPVDASWSLVSTYYDSINVYYCNRPAFADIDNDGDLDLFIGDLGGKIHYYRNEGTPENAVWNLVTDDYFNPNIGSGSAPTFIDIDDDGDFDLFIGISQGLIIYYLNTGTPDSPEWALVTSLFHSIDVGGASNPTFADIDNDGDPDMFIGETDGNINFYHNDGFLKIPLWTTITENYIYLDVGYYSSPAFADIDNDGDLDLFIGEDKGNIIYYRNDGTESEPEWTFIDNEYYSINVAYDSSPTFGDIDNDSDLDLYIGSRNGDMHFYQNDGTPEEPIWTFVSEFLDLGSYVTPVFIDIDNDGDLDLYSGEADGDITFCKNEGIPSSASWKIMYCTPDPGSFTSPAFTNIYGNGKKDLFIGEEQGNINYYIMDTTAINPYIKWIRMDDNYGGFDVGQYSTPVFADIDNDGDLDLFIGEGSGGINFWRNMTDNATQIESEADIITNPYLLEQNYPNPFNATTTITFQIPKNQFVTIEVYKMNGQKIITLVESVMERGEHHIEFNSNKIPSGLYMYQLKTKDCIKTMKMMLLK